MARIFRKLAQLLDVDLDTTAPADGDSLTYDLASEKWVPEAVSGGGGGGAPTTVDYLVGTASGSLSAEIVVGTSPGGELGGTWASPTVDATHSGSSHASVQAAAEATAAAALSTHSADTTGVHGIADTSALLDTGDIGSTVQAKDPTLDTYAGIDPSANVQSVLGAADYAAIRSLLGLVIGTNVQAFDADLSTWAGLTPSAFFQTLVDDADAATARATLGVIASLFQNGGAQEISVAGLSGQLADSQPTAATLVDSGVSTDGQVLTSDGAGGAAWETPAAGGGSGMPVGSEVTVFPMFDHSDIAGTFVFVADAANQAMNGYVQNSSTNAQNDEVSLGSVYLGAGTWVADCYGVSGAERAIWTIRLDSTDTATADFYTASLTFNKKVTSSSFSVASAGSKTLSVKAATKNASSSDYYLTMTMIVFRRTA